MATVMADRGLAPAAQSVPLPIIVMPEFFQRLRALRGSKAVRDSVGPLIAGIALSGKCDIEASGLPGMPLHSDQNAAIKISYYLLDRCLRLYSLATLFPIYIDDNDQPEPPNGGGSCGGVVLRFVYGALFAADGLRTLPDNGAVAPEDLLRAIGRDTLIVLDTAGEQDVGLFLFGRIPARTSLDDLLTDGIRIIVRGSSIVDSSTSPLPEVHADLRGAQYGYLILLRMETAIITNLMIFYISAIFFFLRKTLQNIIFMLSFLMKSAILLAGIFPPSNQARGFDPILHLHAENAAIGGLINSGRVAISVVQNTVLRAKVIFGVIAQRGFAAKRVHRCVTNQTFYSSLLRSVLLLDVNLRELRRRADVFLKDFTKTVTC